MMRIRAALDHPFSQAILLLVGSYLLFTFGIAYIPPLLGVESAPVPSSVVVEFMFIAIVAILIHVSSDEARWHRFKEPVVETLVRRDRRKIRLALLIIVPLLAGFATYAQTRPRVSAPIHLRAIHPAPPGEITVRGKRMTLTGLENPLRKSGDLAQHVAEGKRVYYQNCLACHGDRLDGMGHFAHGFSPTPMSFADQGTIAQLSESFVFWRIAKGGPGLPREGAPWNSAMPVWEDYLTENEIWAVSIFLYAQTGWQPRREETAH